MRVALPLCCRFPGLPGLPGLFGLFGLLVLLAIATAWSVVDAEDPAPDAARAPGATADGDPWAGSGSCKECHAEIHASWSRTAHANTLRDFGPGVAARPFDGDLYLTRDIEHRLGPGAEMTCEGPGGEEATFAVEMVIGVRRIQMFTTSLPDGRIQVLPVFLEVPTGEWFDYADFIFGGPRGIGIPPDSANSWYGPARNFNSRCGGCHTLNYDIGYDADAGTYQTTWSERAISCENCHGPARAHVGFHRRRESGKDPIVNPAKLGAERLNQVCGRCHAEGLLVDPDFSPGEDLFAHVDVAGLDDARHTLPDGRARELIHELVPTTQSRCGPISCTKCHDPHGRGIPGDLIRPLSDRWTCTQCHEEYRDPVAVETHTHHPAGSAGSSCFGCHMPQMIIEGGHGRVFDHTISVPSMINSRTLGLPNACRGCHLEKDPDWEVGHFDRWYPEAEGRNHRVPLAAAIAAAREGKPEARDGLLQLLEDPNPVYRAGAAWALSAFPEVDLRKQLGDPHPLVRRAAIRGVGATAVDALIPLLDSGSAVLRNAAVDALVTKRIETAYDFISARPALRSKALAVLKDLVVRRNDRYRLHYLIGILHEIEGDREQALVSYRRTMRLNPFDARLEAHVERLSRDG